MVREVHVILRSLFIAARLALVLALILAVGSVSPLKAQPAATESGGDSLQNSQNPVTDSSGAAASPSASSDSMADTVQSQSQSPPEGSQQPGFFSKLLRSFGLERSPAKQGNRAYHSQDYDKALQDYAEAEQNPPSPGAMQALAYDAGNAEFRQKRYPEAIADYTKALQGKDAGLAARAYYNMGNAFFRKGEAELQSGQQEGLSDYREALARYKKSLEINPSNTDAKRNVEVTQARIKELLDRQKQQEQQQPKSQKPPEPDARAKEALARALQLAQERRYEDAKVVLDQIIGDDPTAASYKSYSQRMDDVIKILKGEKPTPPTQQDPRAQQGGTGVI